MKRFFALIVLTSPLTLQCYLDVPNGIQSYKKVEVSASIESDDGIFWDSSTHRYSNDGILLGQDAPGTFLKTDSGYQAKISVQRLQTINGVPKIAIAARVCAEPIPTMPLIAPFTSYFIAPTEVGTVDISLRDNEPQEFPFDGSILLKVTAYIKTFQLVDGEWVEKK